MIPNHAFLHPIRVLLPHPHLGPRSGQGLAVGMSLKTNGCVASSLHSLLHSVKNEFFPSSLENLLSCQSCFDHDDPVLRTANPRHFEINNAVRGDEWCWRDWRW